MEVAAVLYFLRNGVKLHFYSLGTIFEENMRGVQMLHGEDQPVVGVGTSRDGLDRNVGVLMNRNVVVCHRQSGKKLIDHTYIPQAVMGDGRHQPDFRSASVRTPLEVMIWKLSNKLITTSVSF